MSIVRLEDHLLPNLIMPSGPANVVTLDGSGKYTFDAAGLQAAITAAQGGGGSSGVVLVGGATISLGTTTITMPSSVSIVGVGVNAAIFNYSGTGSAFDFPAGTVNSGLINGKIELMGTSGTPTGISLEGNSGAATLLNTFINVEIGTEQMTGTQRGIVFTPTPTGPNGSIYILRNLFRDIRIGSSASTFPAPVVSNGDFLNIFDNIQVFQPSNGISVFSGAFVSDRMNLTVNKPGSSNVTALAISANCNGNIVNLSVNLGSSVGNACINDAAGGNTIIISNGNLTPLGTAHALSYGVNNSFFGSNFSPQAQVSGLFLPSKFTVANLPTVANGATEGELAYATNGRKVGEGVGSGTGVVVYFSNGSWRVFSTDAAVAA